METADHKGGKQVGQADLEELRDAADNARRWDSKYGGGNWKANSVTACLTERAAPLLQGSFSDEVGRELFSVTAELSRLAGWTAFDTGEHDVAQRHFIQALRLARAGGDVQLGCYVLTTMAMQSLMRGFVSEAVDMAQGAFERAKGEAVPRVLAFTKLIEARAHARGNDPRAASRALTASEDLPAPARPCSLSGCRGCCHRSAALRQGAGDVVAEEAQHAEREADRVVGVGHAFSLAESEEIVPKRLLARGRGSAMKGRTGARSREDPDPPPWQRAEHGATASEAR